VAKKKRNLTKLFRVGPEKTEGILGVGFPDWSGKPVWYTARRT